MKLELSDNSYYLLYCQKRLSLPLYYCDSRRTHRFDKGYYRCEDMGSYVRVYDTARGTDISKFLFGMAFEKPSKLRLFFYKHFS
jgi:hypothetical protein